MLQKELSDLSGVPEEYRDLLFSIPIDCMTLISILSRLVCHLVVDFISEHEALDKYFADLRATGTIVPS